MQNAVCSIGHAAKNLSSSRSPQFRTTVKTLLALLLGTSSLSTVATAQTAGSYQATNLISDGSVTAAVTDPQFIDPWGVSIGPAFWINTQSTGLDYVATATGSIPFKVAIPAAAGAGTGTPTGTVFTGSATGFKLPNGSPATFLFSSLDGTISGWNSAPRHEQQHRANRHQQQQQ